MKQVYMSRLRRAARWYLPDAAEVIADYEELAAERSDAELERDLGTPRAVVSPLIERKELYRWYALLGLMALTGLCPLLRMCFGVFPRTLSGCFIPLAGCLFAAWYWGLKPQTPRAPLPKRLLPALLALLLASLAVSAFLRWLLSFSYAENAFPTWLIGWNHPVTLFCALFVAAGLLGLVLARMLDRRWRALYLLAMTALSMTVTLMKPLCSLSLATVDPVELTPYTVAWTFAAVFGLVCTLWSLLC